jgi:transcriptional regulator with XRE-family HTH domain
MDAGKTGNFIAEKRKAINMTQKELADKLHITDKAISKWERGLSFPDISVLIPLSEVLNISLYDLLTGGNSNE